MKTCENCGNLFRQRECENCITQSAKAQPHVKSPGGFRLLGAGLGGVALAGLLVAGIAGSSTLSPRDALKEAAVATNRESTASFSINMSVHTNSAIGLKSKSAKGSGFVDFTGKQSSITIVQEASIIREIQDGSIVYWKKMPASMKYGGMGPWLSIDAAGGLWSLTGTASDSLLAIVQHQRSWANVTRIEPTNVDGHACTKYVVPIATAELERSLAQELGLRHADIGKYYWKSLLRLNHLSEEISVDDESHVIRQIRISVRKSIFGKRINEVIEMTFDYFGGPVSIQIPASVVRVEEIPSLF